MDGHHLTVHREGRVCMNAATRALEGDERLCRVRLLRLLVLLLFRLILLFLQFFFEIGNRRAITGSLGNATMLESPAFEARTVVIVALPNHFATANDDAAVAVVQRRLRSLLEAETQIVVGLHFGC